MQPKLECLVQSAQTLRDPAPLFTTAFDPLRDKTVSTSLDSGATKMLSTRHEQTHFTATQETTHTDGSCDFDAVSMCPETSRKQGAGICGILSFSAIVGNVFVAAS